MRIKRFLLIICAVLMVQGLFAKNIIFTCEQNYESWENSVKTTYKFEDYLFEAFFDSGVIVGNVPCGFASASESGDISEIKLVLEENADYVLAVYLEYDSNYLVDARTSERYPYLKSVSWKIFDGNTEKLISQDKKSVKKYNSVKALNEGLKQISDKIVVSMVKSIGRR